MSLFFSILFLVASLAGIVTSYFERAMAAF